MGSFVSLSDIHFPYEDQAALEVTRKFLADFRPDTLILNGDIYDCPQLSKYSPRRQEVARSTQLADDLAYGKKEIEKLVDSSGAKTIHFISGNHEDRLDAYIGRGAPGIASLAQLEPENIFTPAKATFHRYGSGVWLCDTLFVYHGTRIGKNWTADERMDVGASTITGHQHKQGVSYFRDRSRQYKNVGQGCLCRLDPPYLRTPPNWQQGFAFGWVWGQDKFRVVEAEILKGDYGAWTAPLGQRYES